MNSVPEFLFALVGVGVVLWQLITGKAYGGSWGGSVTRQENPGMYWFLVLVQSAILIIVLVTGKTSWHFS